MRKNRSSFASSSMPTACGLGLVLTLLIEVTLILVSAICISNEYFSLNVIGYLAIVIQFISVFAGIFLAGKMVSSRKILACIITAVTIIVLQLCGTLLFFEGISPGVMAQLIATVAATTSGFLLAVKGKNYYGSKKKHRQYR